MVTCESWLFYFIGSSGLQEYFQPWKLVVQDQLFREHGLMNKLSGIGKIADVFRAVAVAGEKQWQIVFSAAAKDFETVFSCVTTIAIRRKRSFVDLKDRSGFFGGSGKNFIIHRIVCVVTVSENFDTRIFHNIDKGFGVFVPGAGVVVPGMHAGNGVIKFT